MTTTDQQAVTVAQIDRDAAALIFPTHAMTIMSGGWDETENVQVFARHRLASVSSASAEGAVDYPAGAIENGREFLRRLGEYDCAAGAISMSTDYQESVRCFEWLSETSAQYANALAASPEPVPATNQAGEVERYAEAFFNAWHPRRWDSIGETLRNRYREKVPQALAALATQPATSQEGEEPTCERCDRGVCVNPHYEDDDRLNRLAATPTPPTLSEDLREALQGFVDDLTDAGRNKRDCLSINHDGLNARIKTARAALAQGQAS